MPSVRLNGCLRNVLVTNEEAEDDESEQVVPSSGRSSQLLAYLRLFRLPNVFTAIADVAMGFIVTRHSAEPAGALACLATASALLYTAGMVLNDVFDVEVDRQERPFRPLPSGKIPLAQARALGFAMLVLGVVLGGLAGWIYADVAALPWRSAAVATALAAFILLYNTVLKHTLIGPLGMGLCRFCNVLLGMSLAGSAADGGLLGYSVGELLVAAGIGTYIVGVTWFARGEAANSQAMQLLPPTVVMLLGIAVLGASGNFLPRPIGATLSPLMFCVLLALLAMSIVRRCGAAMLNPDPQTVQAAVKHSILSLILFDAAVCLVVAPSVYALCVVALLLPTLLLGRWVYST